MRKMKKSESKQVKVFFKLVRDDEGYPPDDWESLWTDRVNANTYAIDNVPFFIKNISVGDIVEAKEIEGVLQYVRLLKKSKNSVIRVIVYDELNVSTLRKTLLELGCDSEQSHIPNLISIHVPPDIAVKELLDYLDTGEAGDSWEYETGSVRW